jgi:hypothetical protein
LHILENGEHPDTDSDPENRQAQQALRVGRDQNSPRPETSQRSLDALINKHERAAAALKTHERLLKGDAAIRDVFGNLET